MSISSLSALLLRPHSSVNDTVRQDLAAEDSNRDANQMSWQREMERAQMAGWLDNGLVNQAGRAPDLSETVQLMAMTSSPTRRAYVVKIADAMTERADEAVRAMPEKDAIVGANMFSVSRITEIDGVAIPTTENLEQRVTARLLRVFSEASTEQASVDVSGRDRVPVARSELLASAAEGAISLPRISLERIGTDVRMWLGVGVHDNISVEDVARIVDETRTVLEANGSHLQDVMYNGKPWMKALASGGVPFYSYFDTRQEG